MPIGNTTHPVRHVLINLKRMLMLAWSMDKRVTAGYYATAGISAVATLVTSIILKYLIDDLITQQAVVTSIPLIILIILGARYLVGLIANISEWALNQVYFDYLFRYKLQNYLTYTFSKKVANLDIAQLEDSEVQNLITKTRDTMTWRPQDFLRHFSYFFKHTVSFVSAFIILLPFGVWIPVSVTLINLPFLYLRSKYSSVQWSIYDMSVPQAKKLWYFMWLFSHVTAVREMRLFQSQEALLTKFRDIQEYIFGLNKKPLANYVKILTLPSFLETIILFLIAYTQLPHVLTGVISIGSFTLLINMIDTLNGGVGASVISFGEMFTHSLFVDHYFEIIGLPKIVKEADHPHLFDRVAPPKIEFRDVSFRYLNGPLVLKHISFVIHPGENVAFVGENGAGKSTVIKLICRFYDVTHGEILVNGVNIKKLKLSQWYTFLGTLFQDFVQYHFTVEENITLGKVMTSSEDRVIEAARKSGAYEFIKKLPKGLDTLLGREFESGQELSVGEWQKLAIARAFYEEAPLLILDEPTSAIDAEAEYEIFNNLERAYKNKTLILVSHRFSTVRNAHTIFVVEQGEITEKGTHDELMKLHGKYARMFTIQAKGYQ